MTIFVKSAMTLPVGDEHEEVADLMVKEATNTQNIHKKFVIVY